MIFCAFLLYLIYFDKLVLHLETTFLYAETCLRISWMVRVYLEGSFALFLMSLLRVHISPFYHFNSVYHFIVHAWMKTKSKDTTCYFRVEKGNYIYKYYSRKALLCKGHLGKKQKLFVTSLLNVTKQKFCNVH